MVILYSAFSDLGRKRNLFSSYLLFIYLRLQFLVMTPLKGPVVIILINRKLKFPQNVAEHSHIENTSHIAPKKTQLLLHLRLLVPVYLGEREWNSN